MADKMDENVSEEKRLEDLMFKTKVFVLRGLKRHEDGLDNFNECGEVLAGQAFKALFSKALEAVPAEGVLGALLGYKEVEPLERVLACNINCDMLSQTLGCKNRPEQEVVSNIVDLNAIHWDNGWPPFSIGGYLHSMAEHFKPIRTKNSREELKAALESLKERRFFDLDDDGKYSVTDKFLEIAENCPLTSADMLD
jgi:hypothetical protein